VVSAVQEVVLIIESAMASRQAAVLARRGATRIASARAGSPCVSGSFLEAAPKAGVLEQRGFATVAILRRSAGLTELSVRFVILSRLHLFPAQIAHIEYLL
jgi:hypothetical protein